EPVVVVPADDEADGRADDAPGGALDDDELALGEHLLVRAQVFGRPGRVVRVGGARDALDVREVFRPRVADEEGGGAVGIVVRLAAWFVVRVVAHRVTVSTVLRSARVRWLSLSGSTVPKLRFSSSSRRSSSPTTTASWPGSPSASTPSRAKAKSLGVRMAALP